MPRGQLDPAEVVAGDLVAQQLGGKAVERDAPGAPDGTHDFDVVELPDGLVVALEVTSACDARLRSVYATGFGKTWAAPTLTADWQVGFDMDAPLDVPRLMNGVEPHMKVLEEHGVSEVGGVSLGQRRPPAAAGRDVADAARQIFDLGAILARRLERPEPGEAARLLLSGHGGASSDLDLVNALVSERANAKAAKLAAATADERHLFVWIDSSYADAELAMFTLPPPSSVPSVPKEIDVLWVATSGKAAGQLFERLWRLQPPGDRESIPA